ncbi:MAG: acetyl-CoA carboxylase carboxyltransferase subunit alpha [Bacilli bacterium]
MTQVSEFEKPVIDLKAKIEELRAYALANNVDFSNEIAQLEIRLEKLESDIQNNLTVWDKVQLARHVERPTTLDYVSRLCTDWIELHGDRLFGDDEAIVGGVARYRGIPVTIIGHQRGKDTKENIRRNFGMPHPEGYRKALRLMKQAEKFGRPIITFIDTKGAYPGKAAEERGQSEAIARNLFEMSGLRVPVVCINIGEGGSGGALGISVGNRILMLQNATYSVISPEGAAAILWKDAARAREAAESMAITAEHLASFGVIDAIVPEVRGGAHKDVDAQAQLLDEVLWTQLQPLLAMSGEQLVEERLTKFYTIGEL